MILGIGIDSVETVRCAPWIHYTNQQLARVFSQPEITYCLAQPHVAAQRFAARFAAREALFKALCALDPGHQVPFLTLCSQVTIMKTVRGTPHMTINWPALTLYNLELPLPEPTVHLSITHTESTATVYVIIEAATYR